MYISDKEYYEIIAELGYPVVDEESLEFNRQQIKDNFIFPALREFFIWFPKTQMQSTQVSSTFSIDFPDEFTYGVVDARINSSISGNGRTGSIFLDTIHHSQSSSRMYGTPYDYGVTEAKHLERSFRKASMNKNKVERLDVDNVNKKLTGFTNFAGELTITWAKFSNNFDDVPFIRKTDVIELAKSKVLRGFALLRSQLNSDIGVDLNTSDLMSRADDLERKVMDKWKAISKVTIIRS